VEEPVAAPVVEEPVAAPVVEEPVAAPVGEEPVAQSIVDAVNDLEKECSITSKVISDSVVGKGDFEVAVNGEKASNGHAEDLTNGVSKDLVSNGHHETGDA